MEFHSKVQDPGCCLSFTCLDVFLTELNLHSTRFSSMELVFLHLFIVL